jgi:hypothetical protein
MFRARIWLHASGNGLAKMRFRRRDPNQPKTTPTI